MNLCDEAISFIIFVGIGFIFSIIFDLFRAIRSVKKPKNGVVYIQDILYFLIIGIILLISILNIRKDAFRLYLILGIVLGIVIYVSIIGNKIRNIFICVYKMSGTIFSFIFLPIKLYFTLFDKELRKIEKYIVEYCKKISYMINSYHKKMFCQIDNLIKRRKTKEGRVKNDKSRQTEC